MEKFSLRTRRRTDRRVRGRRLGEPWRLGGRGGRQQRPKQRATEERGHIHRAKALGGVWGGGSQDAQFE